MEQGRMALLRERESPVLPGEEGEEKRITVFWSVIFISPCIWGWGREYVITWLLSLVG
jgi:hypothetical protein